MPEAQRGPIDWEERTLGADAISNTMLPLRSVLLVKALDYMHPQGLVHWDNIASDIFVKMSCQCYEVIYYIT